MANFLIKVEPRQPNKPPAQGYLLNLFILSSSSELIRNEFAQ